MKNINLLETWDEVVDVLTRQHKFNLDITPSCVDLKCTKKKKSELFKEYTTKWRNLATQITPEPTDKELMNQQLEFRVFIFILKKSIACDQTSVYGFTWDECVTNNVIQ